MPVRAAHQPLSGLFRLLAIGLTASAMVSAAPANHAPDLPRYSGMSRSHGWVLTDLDGDRIADMAAAGPGRVDGQGYAREVSVKLAGSEKTFFTVRTPGASIRLSVRDIDGDDDRDLVILESWSLRPIGIWLNDGHGHFEEGDIGDYSSLSGKPEPRSLSSCAGKEDASFALHEQRSPSAALTPAAQTGSQLTAFALRILDARLVLFVRSNAHPRAPPSLS